MNIYIGATSAAFGRGVLGFALVCGLAVGCGSEPEAEKPPQSVKAMRVLDASSLSQSAFPGRAEPGPHSTASPPPALPPITV